MTFFTVQHWTLVMIISHDIFYCPTLDTCYDYYCSI